MNLQPALFGAYRNLSKLRYDYPLVLIDDASGGDFVKSLKDITDGLLQEIAPHGIAGEKLRQQVLSLEQEIRELVAGGRKGSLLKLWNAAQRKVISRTDKAARKALRNNLLRARNSLGCDGALVDCDAEFPARFMTHVWAVSQQAKKGRLRARVEELAQKLSNILRVDFMHSEEARGAENLKRSMGSADQTMFDFQTMSRILRTVPAGGPLPGKRRKRINAALSVLKSHKFVMQTNKPGREVRQKAALKFVFDNCDQALTAFQDRMRDMVELVNAISIAELEIDNHYNESKHDPFFDRFDEKLLRSEDLALFPSYLICLSDGIKSAAEQTAFFEILSSGLPFKFLVQCNDILEELSFGSGQMTFGIRGQHLASMALGMNNAFVLQAGSSSLYRLRKPILRGMANQLPTLFSVFSGCVEMAGKSGGKRLEVAPYLRAAAAVDARAFPCFFNDPNAGNDWASRFSLDGNPQADTGWLSHQLQYEDSEHQRASEDIAFTFVDFVACDRRYAENFACVPRAKWHHDMVPVDKFLRLDADTAATKVPYIWMIDESNGLHRAIVEDRLIDAARRCRDLWHGLRERGRVNNSDARTQLAEAKETREQEKERLLAEKSGQTGYGPERPASSALEEAAVTGQVTAPPETTEAATPETADLSPDEPYIEMSRCTTCNECTEINNKMFVYNENMQAYIADPDAGSYRQLVEAAESCQVCIIHPGLPRDPNEPNLDELIARAESFNVPSG